MGGGSVLSLNSQDGSTRPLLTELQQTSLLLSGPGLSHRTRGPDRPAPGSSLLQAQSGQALPRHLCGEAAEPISSAECVYTPTFSHTHTHTCGGWPAGYSLLVTDLVGTQLCQGHSLWMSHAQPSQLSEAPFPQSPTPSLDSPPSHHGNSSRSFFGASGTPPC